MRPPEAPEQGVSARRLRIAAAAPRLRSSAADSIVADVDHPRIAELLAPDPQALGRLIRKEG
jgi:hypothetical protein